MISSEPSHALGTDLNNLDGRALRTAPFSNLCAELTFTKPNPGA